MPSKSTIMWRLCDWYVNQNKVPMSDVRLVEIFRAITKASPIPWYHEGYKDFYGKGISPEKKAQLEKIGSLFRHLYGKLLKKKPDDYKLNWVWFGHRHEFPELFDKEDVTHDLNNMLKNQAKEATCMSVK